MLKHSWAAPPVAINSALCTRSAALLLMIRADKVPSSSNAALHVETVTNWIGVFRFTNINIYNSDLHLKY